MKAVMAAIVIAHLIAQRVLMGADMLVVLIVTVIVLVALAAVLVAVIVVHSTVLATVLGVALVVALVAVIAVHTTAQERVKQIVKMTAPAPVQDLVSGRALIIAKIHVQDIAKVVVQLDVLHVMVAVIAAVAMVHAQLDAILPAVRQPMLNFNIFSFSERSFNG